LQKVELIPDLFKTEYRKIVSVLCHLFGMVHVEIAEDITHDTFLLASETWGLKGVPENPTAWLYTVAKNKTKDYLKRNKILEGKIIPEIKSQSSIEENWEIDWSKENIFDSQLKMIFALCHPVISVDSQIGLALRILGGFGLEEIADAFLTNKETIQKRLYRAKEKLREENIPIALPEPSEINARLETVLTTLYLLFNEGYHSSSQITPLRKEMCLEAMRLNYFLLENKSTNLPKVNALMALMCFHSSRMEARTDSWGGTILYEDQDRNLWNDDLIEKGNYFLIKSAQGDEVSKYHLEASIAYWHCSKIPNENKWNHILQLYNQLLQIEYSPITAMSRTYALFRVKGREIALQEAIKLDLMDNHFYQSLLGYLYMDMNNGKAMLHFQNALMLAKTPNDRLIIEKYLKSLKR
jgi:RNA polymerase sigma factor (sigma-70 family)